MVAMNFRNGAFSLEPKLQKMNPIQTRARGWHATTGTPPRIGIGTATVQPFRELRDIAAIKGLLAPKPRDFALFVAGIHLGLRGSDLLQLRWRDLMSADGAVLRRLEVIEAKTKKRRVIAIQERARDALAQWYKHSRSKSLDDYVFPNTAGGSLSIQRLHQLVNHWACAAGAHGHYGTHSLRKTYGFHLRKAGIDIETLMKVFGHTSQAITLRYIGIEQEEIDAANLRLSL